MRLDGAEMLDQANNQPLRALLCIDWFVVGGNQLDAPHRHVARAVRGNFATAIDGFADPFRGEHAAILLGDSRQIGRRQPEERRDGSVTQPVGPVTTRA